LCWRAISRVKSRYIMWSLVRAGTQAWPATVAVIDHVCAHVAAEVAAERPSG